jgi:hypothetical protein
MMWDIKLPAPLQAVVDAGLDVGLPDHGAGGASGRALLPFRPVAVSIYVNQRAHEVDNRHRD